MIDFKIWCSTYADVSSICRGLNCKSWIPRPLQYDAIEWGNESHSCLVGNWIAIVFNPLCDFLAYFFVRITISYDKFGLLSRLSRRAKTH